MKNFRAVRVPVFLWLICFATFEGIPFGVAPADGKEFIFPEMNGWKQSGQPQVYSAETLYEYINGGADLYLKYDFQELKVGEYRNDKKASVTVEVYKHRTPNDAFGIYSQERLSNADYLNIGAQGYSESMVLNFVLGPYYVKLSSDNAGPDDQAVLIAFARTVSQQLEGQASLPGILSSFPSEGKKSNSEKFIARDFLGYSFLHAGFTADYERLGKKFQLFIIVGENRSDCLRMMEKYLKQIGNSERGVAEGPYRVKDPHHGEMAVYWKGEHIWGTMNLDDPDLRSMYLKQFEEISRRQ